MGALFDLGGKAAIVTGSTKGIGEAIAHRFAEHGAKVVVSSRKADACETVAGAINAKHKDRAMAIPCNISHKDQLENLYRATVKAWGRVDILVCNAAVNPYFGPSKDISDEAFDRVMGTNIRSNHWLCSMAAPDMAARGGGVIIIISSIGGLRGSPFLGAYGISKAADMQLARNLAVEYGSGNVRVNCIAPGLIKTYFARALWEDPEILAQTTSRSPLGRIGVPDEIAGAAVFLAGSSGAFMTGQFLVIDGGGTIA